MSKANPTGKPTPTDVQFVEAWKNPEVKTRKDVVKVLTDSGLHITISSVYAREKSYREAGVNLRELEKGQGKGKKIDATKLNALLATEVAEKPAV